MALAALIVSIAAALFTLWQAVEAFRFRKQSIELAKEQGDDSKKSASAAERSAVASEHSAAIAENTLRISRDQIEIPQRAWVIVGEPELKWGTTIAESSVVTTIKNCGATPTRPMKIEQYCRLQQTFSPVFGSEFAVVDKIGPLGPGHTHQIRAAIDMTVEPNTLKFADMRSVLSVYGIVTYEDVFMHRHATKFSYVYKFELRKFVVTDIFNDFINFADPVYDDE